MTTQTVSSRVTLAAAVLPRRAHTAATAVAAGSSTLGARARFVCTSCRQQKQQQQQLQQTTRQRTPLARRAFSSYTPKRQSASTQAPPPPPRAGYVRLTSRRLISLSGADAPKFLQGILTASVFPNPNANRGGGGGDGGSSEGLTTTPGFYCGFLNATGRVLHDVFVYRDTGALGGVGADDPSLAGLGSGGAFLIEVDATQVDALAKHLKRYMLRSKLRLRVLDEDECVAWHAWDDRGNASGPGLSALLAPSEKPGAGPVILRDDRAPGLGYRVLSGGTRSGNGSGSGSPVPAPLQAAAGELGLEHADDAAYRVRRYLLGVPEGQGEIPRGDALPLESNMDLMGGIDFRKGCYVGQELTIRTRHRGVVRKRILPCVLYGGAAAGDGGDAGTQPPESLEYVPGWTTGPGGVAAEDVPHDLSIGREGKRGRSAGNWLAGVGNVGLALCRLQIMTDVQLPGDTAVAPFDPTNEFVMKWGSEVKEGSDKAEGEGGSDGVGAGAGEGKAVKIKAFVPGWLRTRLDESNVSH